MDKRMRNNIITSRKIYCQENPLEKGVGEREQESKAHIINKMLLWVPRPISGTFLNI